MRSRHLVCLAAGSTALILGLIGCGGGGSSSSGSNVTPRSASVGVYVTDGFREDFSQVYVTLFKIEIGDGTQFRAVFEDTTGKIVNASALASVAQLLSSANIPAGNYTQARITLSDHINLVTAANGTATNTPIDDSVGTHANGQVTLVVPAATTITPGSANKLVLDIDLPGFQLSGGRVRPSLHGADDARFQSQSKEAEVKGTVGNASGTGFQIALANSQTLTVQTTGATSIFSGRQGSAIALANGQVVEVKGSVDPATQVITATSVKVEDAGEVAGGEGENHGGTDDSGGNTTGGSGTTSGSGAVVSGADAEGTVTALDANAHTLMVSLKEVEHFQPAAGSLTILTTATTVFERHGHGHDGSAVSFADITSGTKVEAVGSYDPTTQVLTAARVELR